MDVSENMRPEMLLAINERLCDLMDALMYYYNPCQTKDNSCLVVKDIENSIPVRHCCYSRGGDGCLFLRGSKCIFRNINCKLWFCATALEAAGSEFLQAVQYVESFARLYSLTRRPFLGQRYVGREAELESVRARQGIK